MSEQYQQARNLHQQGLLNEAQKIYEALLAEDPKHPDVLHALAVLLAQKNRYEPATKIAEQALQYDTNNATIINTLANLYLRQANYEKAKQYFELCLQYNSKHKSALGYLGQISLQQRHYQQAISYFKQRLVFDSQHANSHHDLGLAYLETKQYLRAKPHFEKAIALGCNDCERYYHYGICLLQCGDYKAALQAFMQQLECQPSIETDYNIAVLLMYEGRSNDAINYFDRVLTQNPKHIDSHINLGVMYLNSQQTRQAISHYQTALTLAPEREDIQHILAALQHQNTSSTAPQRFVSELFDQYAAYYDIHLNRQLKYQVPNEINKLLLNAINTDTHHWDVLDLGCGTGLVAEALQLSYHNIDGIDASQNMLDVAKHKNHYHELIHGMIPQALDQVSQYQLVIAADVFTYIGKLDQVIDHISRHSNEKGYLCFSVEQHHQDQDFLLQETIRYAHNRKYINALASKYGFNILEQRSIILREQNQQTVEGLLCLWQKA